MVVYTAIALALNALLARKIASIENELILSGTMVGVDTATRLRKIEEARFNHFLMFA